MKLKQEFLAHTIDDTQVLVDVTQENLNGIIRSNSTAAYIVSLLSDDITKDEIVEAMLKKYDAPREVIEPDVEEILNTLRSVGAIEE